MIKVFNKPDKKKWDTFFVRPTQKNKNIEREVSQIIEQIEREGDQALIKLTHKFDHVHLSDFRVSEKEFEVDNLITDKLKKAIILAKNNIKKFHRSQQISIQKIETSPGVVCWQKSVPVERIGLYIPGGTAPLFSTLLMLGIPAKIAGCKEITVCSPPDKKGKLHPVILYVAKLLGIKNIFKVGGAHAVAAMALGTESIPRVYKIFGPGNQYVTTAKQLIQLRGVAIDMPAGPSEVLIITDTSSNPQFVAADLLSQAEHGADSQVVLLSNNLAKVLEVKNEIEKQLNTLPRKEIIKQALSHSYAIVLENLNECIVFSNAYAPEHLILANNDAKKLAKKITNAGSVFVGTYSCESAGDYASGTNHTLPTCGYARSYSGVSLNSFVKHITFQELSDTGMVNIGTAIEEMADAEELQAHKNAVTLRLEEIRRKQI